MATVEHVEFKTVDGLTLRGHVYHSGVRGSGVAMCPGFNCVKEMAGLPGVAKAFQDDGIAALVYDPRTVGESDRQPRKDIDPSHRFRTTRTPSRI